MNVKRSLTIGLLLITIVSSAQKKDTLNVLFVGNSYTYYNNLSHIVSLMSDSTDTKLITKKSTRGGAWLHQHWNEERGLRTKTLIQNGNFDTIVFQEYSMGPISEPDSLRKYGKLFADLARSVGAKPYLFLVWAREKVPQYQSELNAPIEVVAKENGMTIIPVGKGWELARGYRPSAPLFNDDGTHPAPLGTFLSAAVVVGTMTGQLPEKYPNVPTLYQPDGEFIQLMRLDWLDMVFAMKVARETLGME